MFYCDTHVLISFQNAWQVNFNLSLQSFESHIRGTRNLLDMALSSPARPRFLFVSSVSVAGFGKTKHLREDYLKTETALGGIGYGQSKLVAEKVYLSHQFWLWCISDKTVIAS